ncbi:MAG: cohesin domain-containing protein [Patescibacteria group bacterium]
MKRVVIIVVSLILFLAIPATVFVSMRNQELRKKAAPATTLTLTPTTITKTVNEEFTLEARMDTAANQIVAVELNITFDPAKLEAEWIHNGTMFPNILSSGTVGNGTASIALGATNTTTPITGTGTVATIKFKALAATSAPIAVRFSSDTFVGALNEGSTNALTSSVPSTITITGAEGATPTPTTAAGITPTITLTPTLTPTEAASDSASTSAVTILSPIKNSSVITTQPTILGKAPAGSTVTITVYSDPITVTVTADANGNWTYTLAEPLTSGPHTIVVAAQDPDTGTSHTATLAFIVATGDENGASGSAVPVSGSTENTLMLLGLGMLFILTGSMVPYLRRQQS